MWEQMSLFLNSPIFNFMHRVEVTKSIKKRLPWEHHLRLGDNTWQCTEASLSLWSISVAAQVAQHLTQIGVVADCCTLLMWKEIFCRTDVKQKSPLFREFLLIPISWIVEMFPDLTKWRFKIDFALAYHSKWNVHNTYGLLICTVWLLAWCGFSV